MYVKTLNDIHFETNEIHATNTTQHTSDCVVLNKKKVRTKK